MTEINAMTKMNARIFIPRMKLKHTESSVRNIMKYYNVGIVSSVKMFPIYFKNTCIVDLNFVSAFVEFAEIGDDAIWNQIVSGETFTLNNISDTKEFWICMKTSAKHYKHYVRNNNKRKKLYDNTFKDKIESLEEKVLAIETKLNEDKIKVLEEKVLVIETKLSNLECDLDSCDVLKYR